VTSNRINSILLSTILLVSACGEEQSDDKRSISANIKRTEFGVPHISATNLAGIGFGSGYAQAEDHICVLARGYLKANGELAKYFGPDNVLPGDGENVVSDFSYKALDIPRIARMNYSKLQKDAKALVSGFASGYNHYLEKVDEGSLNLPSECSDSKWVKPITAIDVMAYLTSLSIVASLDQFKHGMFGAEPASINSQANTSISTRANTILSPATKNDVPPNMKKLHLGSNAWALGRAATVNGRGLLLANPHFPLDGNLRFWESHITIPGDLDAMGASLLGTPGVINIGFNKSLAWTHTVSSSERFIVYELTLNPENKTEYIFDGEIRKIEEKTVTIEVNSGGYAREYSRSFFSTHLGPVIEYDQVFPWNSNTAYVIKDDNLTNNDLVDHWLEINRSRNIDEFKSSFERYDGVVFMNTLYADNEGNSFYIDDSNVPKLTKAALKLATTDPFYSSIRNEYGITILPGDSSMMIHTGFHEYSTAPKLERLDFTQNSNDSYWATNPNALMEEHSPLYGLVDFPLSLRTRMSLQLLENARGSDGLFNVDEVELALFSNQSFLANQTLDQLLAQCNAQGTTPITLSTGVAVDISEGCSVLKRWDRRYNIDSIGAHLFREWASNFIYELFSSPFDPSNPKDTPSGLSDNSMVLENLARAILNIELSDFSLHSRLGDLQFFEKPLFDNRGYLSFLAIPWPGSSELEGGFNVFQTNDSLLIPLARHEPAYDVITGYPLQSGLTRSGYPVRFGSSWVMIVNFDESGPKARGLMTYSQSSNASSENYTDQTIRYSESLSLRLMPFKQYDVDAAMISTETISSRLPDQ